MSAGYQGDSLSAKRPSQEMLSARHAGIRGGCSVIRCETECQGRPYTLVCIKTRATWERRLEQYREDITGTRRLAALAGAVPGSDATSRALGIAIEESQNAAR